MADPPHPCKPIPIPIPCMRRGNTMVHYVFWRASQPASQPGGGGGGRGGFPKPPSHPAAARRSSSGNCISGLPIIRHSVLLRFHSAHILLTYVRMVDISNPFFPSGHCGLRSAVSAFACSTVSHNRSATMAHRTKPTSHLSNVSYPCVSLAISCHHRVAL